VTNLCDLGGRYTILSLLPYIHSELVKNPMKESIQEVLHGHTLSRNTNRTVAAYIHNKDRLSRNIKLCNNYK
jgi:hypothetical protein